MTEAGKVKPKDCMLVAWAVSPEHTVVVDGKYVCYKCGAPADIDLFFGRPAFFHTPEASE